MGIQLAPIEGTPYAGGTATGVIYLDANGLQRTDGPTVNSAGDITASGVVKSTSASAPWYTGQFSNVNGAGLGFDGGGNPTILAANGGQVVAINSTGQKVWANAIIGWASTNSNGTTLISGTTDTGIARSAAGTVEVNNGTAGTLGTLSAGILNATAPAITDTPLVVNGTAGQTADLATIGNVTIDASSNMTVGGNVTASGDLTLSSPTVPASASATGTAGTVSWDADYIYICTATDTWKRVTIATW